MIDIFAFYVLLSRKQINREYTTHHYKNILMMRWHPEFYERSFILFCNFHFRLQITCSDCNTSL